MSEEDHTSRSFTVQLPVNLISNIAYFLFNILIGILLVPYFISTLGVAAYGLIPLAASITGYVTIIIDSLNTSVSRFLTVDLHREDYGAANRTFNTALFGVSAIVALMIPFVLGIAWYIPVIFNVPQGQETAAILLFLGVCTAFLIRSWSGNFTVQLFAFNRLDLQNLVNILNLTVQTALILLFFYIFGPNLAFIGGAYLFGAIVASLVAVILAKRVCPYLKTSINSFDRSRVWDIVGMGWWVVINQIGALLFLQIDLIIVNMIFGATSAGEYAIALQWSSLLRATAGVLAFVLTPVVLIYYARRQTDSLIRVSKSAVKLMGLAMALPIGLVCGFAPQLLTVWVGSTFSFLAPLMILLVAPLAINLAVIPLFAVNVAYNEVRIPGIVTLLMGIGNFVLAVLLSLYTGLGYYGIAVAGAITLTLKNAIFTPWYATRVLDIRVHTFTRSMVPGIIAAAFIWFVSISLRTLILVDTLLILIIVCCLIVLVYLVIIWMAGISRFERDLFTVHLPEKLRRFADGIPCYCRDG